MGHAKLFYLTLFTALIFFPHQSNGQIIFKELPKNETNLSDSTFFGITETRQIIPLDGVWKVFPANTKEDKAVEINVPSIFHGKGELIFEKHIYLSKDQVNNRRLWIIFLGINYSADISVNGVIIYRHTGGEFPFKVKLPKDILYPDKNNLLSVKLIYSLDSKNTIPVRQRFLFPHNFGGIFRDVYILETPNVSITNLDLSYKYDPASNRANIRLNTRIEDRDFSKDTTSTSSQFVLKMKFVSPNGSGSQYAQDYDLQLIPNKDKDINEAFELTSPALWSPSNPQSYLAYIELWRGTTLIDREIRSISFYSLSSGKESLKLNGDEFSLRGVTYVPSYYDYGNLENYKQMDQDIKMIKDLGFNAVRFEKSVPHPYYLELCEKYGLLAFIELPINSIPENIADDKSFVSRSENYLANFLTAYKKYSAIAAIGLGSSYLPQSEIHNSLIKDLSQIVKKETNFLTYASFDGTNILPVDNLDLYGVEFYNTPINSIVDKLKSAQNNLGAAKVFISEATYVVNKGNTDGYLNDHSFEAQAKYFEDLFDYSDNNPFPGFFINSMFDYRGDYASLSAGYNSDNLYKIGICGEDRNTDRLGYKVIYSKLHNTDKVTIPIGNKKDSSPIVFILFGLVLAIILGVLVNSGRKFREDASRALMRPYNFFADVRDMRIMSSYHSSILAIIIAATSSLLISNLLFYFRENIILEKLLLSFGSNGIIKTVSYLAWHPIQALIWLTIILLVSLLIITVIVKIASFFVRNKIFLSSVYFTVIWSFLPIVLLIPAGIILFRALDANLVNLYIYLGLLIFALWIFYRLMKGIYVIFDVNAGSVYFYSILLIFFIVGGFLLYYQVKNSAFDYIWLTFKQFNILGYR
ncbi:MAG TPA: glycoside hydrolase family 2 TIM barrel-domain containing protein [Ignavibacteriaceae bacterium]|nr:glycoside hydrolase family 2 TIM barrel-domain containing protein [Ignavibacteriaceae bacterium]